VALKDFTDEDVQPNEIYFFTIGKSPPRSDNDHCCYDFNLVYKSEVTRAANDKLAWKRLTVPASQLGHDDVNTNLVFQFYRLTDGLYKGVTTARLTFGQLSELQTKCHFIQQTFDENMNFVINKLQIRHSNSFVDYLKGGCEL
jgi:hypothetical protein